MAGRVRTVGGALLVLAALWWPAPAAQAALAAQPDVFLEVNPNTIQAGFQVGIRASCGDTLNPASIRSDAFGQLTLTPPTGSPLLTGSATVPEATRAGEYRVVLTCVDGATADATLVVLAGARPTRGPATGGGGTVAGAPLLPLLLAAGGLAALTAGTGLLLRRRPT